jgi:2-keto-3-deoxy-L-rhamnonate aldolase RhmA
MGGVYVPELMQRYIGMGVRLVLAGSDFALLMQAATARVSLIRGFEGARG